MVQGKGGGRVDEKGVLRRGAIVRGEGGDLVGARRVLRCGAAAQGEGGMARRCERRVVPRLARGEPNTLASEPTKTNLDEKDSSGSTKFF